MDERIKQWIAQGKEHYEKREFDQAEQLFIKVLSYSDRFADVHNMMGVIHHDRGRLTAARECFERALSLNPRYTEAALNLVVTYNDLKLYEDAQRIYKDMVDLTGGPQNVEPFAQGKIANLHAEVAQAYLDVGLLSESVQELRKAINLCPHFADLRLKLANVYRQWGEPVAARIELEEAVKVRPAYIPARIALGVVLLILGHTEDAIAHWQEVIKLDPENKSAKMYLRMANNPLISVNLSGPETK
jgi:tetratricopeptide (TPR) repeat protein